MGLQLAVGVREGLKIYYILEDAVKLAIELTGKMCGACSYSHGGHFLAAANGTVILIIDPYSFETKHQLLSHTGNVRVLRWNESDSHLLSICANGFGYGWRSNFDIYKSGSGGKKDTELNNKIEFFYKNLRVHSAVFDEEYEVCAASTSDAQLNLMTTEHGCKPYMELHNDCEFTCLLLSKSLQVLFAGTSKGSVRVYLWPIIKRKGATNTSDQVEFYEYVAYSSYFFPRYFIHADRITSLNLSANGEFLATTGADGTLFFSTVREMFNGIDLQMNAAVSGTNSRSTQQQAAAALEALSH